MRGSGEDFSDCSEAEAKPYEVEVKQVAKVELRVPVAGSSARARLKRRKSRAQATSPGVMAGMISGLSSMASYKETEASGDEVTDLERARGIAGSAPSAARMRRAKKNLKQKQVEASSSSSPAFVSSFTVASMLSSLTTPSLSGAKDADSPARSAQESLEARAVGQSEAPPMATTGVMASMISGLSSMAGYKEPEVASDDEVHNAWGEDDTAEDFGQRVADLERARGIVLGPARSAARMRRARKNQKNKQVEEAGPSNASTSSSPAFMSTVASMLSFASTSPVPEAKDGSSQVRGLAVPMPTQSSGRERFARRRAVVSSRSESLTSRVSSEVSETGPWAQLARKARKPPRSFLDAAGQLLDLQKFFSSEEEVHNIWGPDDTLELYQQRLRALERARGEPRACMLHHRLMHRRRQKLGDDPFLLA